MQSAPSTELPGIFIVEDEALVAREIRARLTTMGYRVVGVAHSYDQALSRIQDVKPDLLLVDIRLQTEQEGIDVARDIVAERDIPIIFLTAYSDENTVSKAKLVAPYGYIIKPVENRELQITIEIALYKHRVERELNETRQLLATALQCIGNGLVFIGPDGGITNLNQDAEEIFGWSKGEAIGLPWNQFLQLDPVPSLGAIRDLIEQALQTEAVTRLSPFLIFKRDGTQLLLDGIVGPIRSGDGVAGGVLILRELAEIHDPVESLPLPTELMVGPDSKGILLSQSSFVLLLIRPDNIGDVLEELPEGAEEQVVREITAQLNRSLRSTDLASLFAGAIFSASLPYTSLEEGSKIAEIILHNLSSRSFLDGDVYLRFSVGLAYSDPDDHQDSPLELFRRANWALNVAKESGGSRVVHWNPSVEIGVVGNMDRQSEMFSPNVGRDYRNMLLLWNTMTIISKALPLEELIDKLVTNLHKSFDLSKVALFGWEGEDLKLYSGCTSTQERVTELHRMELPPEHQARLRTMLVEARQQEAEVIEKPDGRAYCVPLSRNGILGVFYLCGEPSAQLRQKDLLFIGTLLDYFAIPFESALLALKAVEEETTEQVVENQLIYQSAKMVELMDHVQLVAPTDATVLISGESGTGKELVAHHLHEQSPRRDNPFIIVDCGAIVESLIESELFGHTKGAFTGADKAAPGRLKEAHGGSVLLDEIGDLPLDIQVKLLRFVEDRQLVAVGSTQYETVDTRVIAATHQDLELAVRTGRFREDLFYRLNVFTLHSPPLRERKDDILLLAQRFLSKYSKQYSKRINGFTADAELALMGHPWPGNVRELINILIRSVILCQDNQVSTIHLGIFPPQGAAEISPQDKARIGIERGRPLQPEVLEKTLSLEFERFVHRCQDLHMSWPLGSWLEEDVILASLSANNQVVLRTATALSLPESTLRRKINKIKENYQQQMPERPPDWAPVQALLTQLITVARSRNVPATDFGHLLLLKQIRQHTRNHREAARLAGVSVPTYRRSIEEI